MTPTAGLSFKPIHLEQALACPAAGLWFEVHAENYMVDGGPRLATLEGLRTRFPPVDPRRGPIACRSGEA